MPLALTLIALEPAGAQALAIRVVEDDSFTPVASVAVRIRHRHARQLMAEMETGDKGQVDIRGLTPGDYSLEFVKPNYVPASMDTHLPTGGLLVRLTRYGAISGMVMDADGRPVAAQVRDAAGQVAGLLGVVLLSRSPGGGELSLVHPASIKREGRYRFDVPPGEYVVALFGPGTAQGVALQLYPENRSPRIFAVGGGHEFSVDFTVLPRATFTVSGHIDLPNPGMRFSVTLGTAGEPAFPVARAEATADGAFRLDNVPLGTYNLYAKGPVGTHTALASTLAAGDPYFGRTEVTLAGQNIEGLTVPVSRSRSLMLLLTGPSPGCPPRAGVTLRALEPWGPMLSRTLDVSFGKQQAVTDLAPGRYRITTEGLGSNCYQTDQFTVDLGQVLEGPVRISHSMAGSLQGVLRAPKPGDFAVILAGGETGATVAQHIAYPDSDGRFRLDRLAPGYYRLGSCPTTAATRSTCMGDPAVMQLIQVKGGGTVDVEMVAGQAGQ